MLDDNASRNKKISIDSTKSTDGVTGVKKGDSSIFSLTSDAPEFKDSGIDTKTKDRSSGVSEKDIHISPSVNGNAASDKSELLNEDSKSVTQDGKANVVKENFSTNAASKNTGGSFSSRLNWKILAPLFALIVLLAGYTTYSFFFKKVEILSPVVKENTDESKDVSNTGLAKKDEMFENPLNGRLVPMSEAVKFKDKKPIAVMVNNYVIARPSAGLSYADVVYEAVAEGGITRLMPIFFSQHPEKVASVRSARYYFVDLAAGYKAHYIHWGAAHVPPCQKLPKDDEGYCPPVDGKVETNPDVDAYDEIVRLGVPNLDGGNYSSGDVFGRDPDRVKRLPIEHTAYVRFDGIYDLAKRVRPEANWHKYRPIEVWYFKDDAPLSERGDIGFKTPITYNYWDTIKGFDVKWVYDKENNEYIRYQGGVKQTDELNGKDLRAKTVIIRFTKESEVGDRKHHLYHEIVGSGDALVFEDGKVIKGTWTRTQKDERDVYKDLDGNPIKFVRGQIWIQLVPEGNSVEYWKVQDNTAPK